MVGGAFGVFWDWKSSYEGGEFVFESSVVVLQGEVQGKMARAF